MPFSSKFTHHLCQQYPALEKENIGNLIAPNLLSPHKVILPLDLKSKIQDVIQTFESLRGLSSYQQWVQQKWGAQFNPGNESVFMSYDFHVTPDKDIKLIEINTNASFLALGWEMFKFHHEAWNADFHINDLKACFLSELQLAGYQNPLQKIIITDEKPQDQKLYIEFLLYREIFNSWGIETHIADIEDSHQFQNADFIYNRSTDFYFESDVSKKLKDIYLAKESVVSPNPYEYRLLADKENFIHWTQPEFWNEVPAALPLKSLMLSVLPKTRALSEVTKDAIWSERKNLFFKPKRAFGSKMTFKGASISRKAFDELFQADALAQEIVPAPEMPFDGQSYKYDLRCYAYQNQFQGCLARLYQGQVTNLRTEGGGFACVNFQC